jgi:hypothetical protein
MKQSHPAEQRPIGDDPTSESRVLKGLVLNEFRRCRALRQEGFDGSTNSTSTTAITRSNPARHVRAQLR